MTEPAITAFRTRPLPTALAYAALAFAVLQAMGPVIFILTGSLKSLPEFYVDPWGMPKNWLFTNYPEAIKVARVGDHVLNSVIAVGLGLIILVVCAATTAYALARFAFPGRNFVLGIILLTMMVPPDILTVPLFLTLRSLGLLGSYFGLALIYAVGGFGMAVFLLRGYFMDVPRELEDAARMDGASTLQVLWHVILPLSIPGFLTVVIIQAIGMWNDLYLSFVFIRDPEMATVPLGLLNFFRRDSVDWPHLLAALTILTLPVLVFYAMAQRRFVEGITSGAIK